MDAANKLPPKNHGVTTSGAGNENDQSNTKVSGKSVKKQGVVEGFITGFGYTMDEVKSHPEQKDILKGVKAGNEIFAKAQSDKDLNWVITQSTVIPILDKLKEHYGSRGGY